MAYVKAQFQVPQLVDINGDTAVGYKIHFFLTGTGTRTPVYSDSAGTALSDGVTTGVVALNSAGLPQTAGGTVCDIYLDTGVIYKYQIYDASGSAFGPTVDPYVPQGGYADPLAPTYLKTVSDIINGSEVSALRFIATSSHSAIRDFTSTTNLAANFDDIVGSGARNIYFPYGRYQKEGATTPASNQRWRGDGIDATILQIPQANNTLDYNFLENSTSDLSDFHLMDMTLKGSLDSQTTAASSQKGFALYSRGAVNRVSFVRVKFTKWGDQSNSNGGGIILGQSTSSLTTGKASENIDVHKCIFDHNGNVPGFYFSMGGTGLAKGIRITGNTFTGAYDTTGAQNCVYILGADATHYIEGVVIQGNYFPIAHNIDQCIELNWVKDFVVNDNPCTIASTVGAANGHILLRDGTYSGTVASNVARDLSGNGVEGITIVNGLSGSQNITNVTITANTVEGFTDGIQIGSGAVSINATGNVIKDCTQAALKIASCSDVLVNENYVYNCGYLATLGTGGGASSMRRAIIKSNRSYSCNFGVITTVTTSEDIQNCEIIDNVDIGSSGTNMVDFNTAASTGNVFDNNRSSLVPINTSHIGNFEQVRLAQIDEVATGTFTCDTSDGITRIDSSGGAVTATLPDASHIGVRRKIVMTDATTSSTLSVTNHSTSSPEVFTFADANDYLVLEWTGALWVTVLNQGVAV